MIRFPIILSIGLMLGASASAQEPAAPQPAGGPVIAMADLVLGAEICSNGARRESVMLERIETAGWTRTIGRDLTLRDTTGRTSAAGINLFERNGVKLSYFHSNMMKSCTASALFAGAYDPAELVEALSAHFGKAPEIDIPGQRYFYHLRGRGILTVQIKPSGEQIEVSLGTVH